MTGFRIFLMVVTLYIPCLAFAQSVLNQVPIASNDVLIVSQSASFVIPVAELTANDQDADGDALSILFIDDWENGRAIYDEVANVITFTPDANVDNASFMYALTDGLHVGYDGLAYARVTLSINGDSTQDNIVPVAGPDSFTVLQNSSLELNTATLLANDTDLNAGDILEVVAISNMVNADVQYDPVGQRITFTAPTGFVGTSSFDYTISDGTDTAIGVVSIEVAAGETVTNTPPVAFGDQLEARQNTLLVIQVSDLLANDSDLDGDALSILFVDDWENGIATYDPTVNTIAFMPTADFTGAAGFTYVLTDGNHEGYDGLGYAYVNIVVSPAAGDANTAPVANADQLQSEVDIAILINAAQLLSNDMDANGDALQLTGVSSQIGGTVTFDAQSQIVNFVPEQGYTGIASFSYTISDGELSATAEVEIEIANVALFSLAVTSGSGSGDYSEGSVVSVVANVPPSGQVFVGWTGNVANLADINAPTTTFTISGQNAELTANYAESDVGVIDNQPPSAPIGLTFSDLRARSVHMQWNASVDNLGVSEYIVLLNGIEYYRTRWTSRTLQELLPQTTYSITVIAVDEAGNQSVQSAPLVVQTIADSHLDEYKTFIMGHSLINHDFPGTQATRETNVPHWLYLLSESAGHNYAMDGEFGNFYTHARNLPPENVMGVELVPSGWGGSLSSSDYDSVIVTAANFIQLAGQGINDSYVDQGVIQDLTPISALETIIDHMRMEQQVLGARWYIYENWPDAGVPQFAEAYGEGDGVSPTDQQVADYHAYTSGEFHDWWIQLHDHIVASRADVDVKLIPVGPVIAGMLTELPQLASIRFEELYEDNAPHGRATKYFLAALITYMALFVEQPPLDFQMPATIHPAVRDNYGAIIDYAWARLSAFNDAHGRSRVW